MNKDEKLKQNKMAQEWIKRHFRIWFELHRQTRSQEVCGFWQKKRNIRDYLNKIKREFYTVINHSSLWRLWD